MDTIIREKRFSDIKLSDSFFDSLRESYAEFEDWFRSKSDEGAYVTEENEKIIAFMYIKREDGAVRDVEPPINCSKILKVGTYKIDSPDTKLSERYIKKIFDVCIEFDIKYVYVTVFSKHIKLLDIFKKYGFIEHGKKVTKNGQEIVLLKDFVRLTGNIYKDYPAIDIRNRNIWLLGIYPEYHTRLFPDSILKTEDVSLIENLTHTNSISKVYVGKMKDMCFIRPNDVLVIYRTKDDGKIAGYNSVATSLCVVDDIIPITDFGTFEEFKDYINYRSVLSDDELEGKYSEKNSFVIRMTYNIALKKRLTKDELDKKVGLDGYWGLMSMTSEQLNHICKLGKVDESYIIN